MNEFSGSAQPDLEFKTIDDGSVVLHFQSFPDFAFSFLQKVCCHALKKDFNNCTKHSVLQRR